MDRLDIHKKFCINSDYVFRQIAGDSVLIPIKDSCMITNAVLSPNETASSLIKTFQTPHTQEEAVQIILQEYDAVEEDLRKSIDGFIKESVKLGILKEVD